MLTNLIWTAVILLGSGHAALIQRQQPHHTAIPPINSTQALAGLPFNGSAVCAAPLPPQTVIQPAAQLLHESGGNQGHLEFPGPLGRCTKATSYAQPLYTLWWGLDGDLTAATTVDKNGTTVLGVCAFDPKTLQKLSCWTPEDPTERVNFAYSELLLEKNDLLLNSPPGNLYVVHRDQNGSTPTFITTRKLNLTEMGVFGEGEALLNGLFDTDGNIWFTSGAFAGNIGDPNQNSTTFGYIEPDNTVHRIHVPNEVIENGIAVSNTTMFIQSGPSGANDHAYATGYVYAFKPGQPGNASSLTVAWNVSYDAGSFTKPGGFGRGSGTSITLLGNDYLALVDHNDVQASVKVYNQTSGQNVCSVPIFSPNFSAADNGLLNAWDGKMYGVIVLNDYNTTSIHSSNDTNGIWNDMSGQAPGFARVDVEPQADGAAKCGLRWDLPLRVKGVSVMSTKAGLIYAYIQDPELALKGQYVWYVVAVDFATGKEAWRIRTGSGGNFNDGFQAMTLSPDGRVIQGVNGGVAVVSDGFGSN